MVYLILIWCFAFTQKSYEFTEQEVMELFNSITELEHADSINNNIITNLLQEGWV